MNRDKQTEIHELAKQMSEAISTAVEQRYIEDEAKLQAVLIENGWRKASEVAREIFEAFRNAMRTEIARNEALFAEDEDDFYEGRNDAYRTAINCLAELKKKYTEEK